MANVEKMLVASIINDQDFSDALSVGIDTDMFRGFQDEWAWLEGYFNKYKKTPSSRAFKDQFPQFAIADVHDTGHYADQVRKEFARRQLTESIKDAASYVAEGNLDEALRILNTDLVKVAVNLGGVNDTDIFESYEEIFHDVQARAMRASQYGSAGVPTGFPSIDEATGGLNPGQLILVGARTGVGKSNIMTRMAASASAAGYVVQYVALEQSRAEVGMRIHAMLSGDIGQEIYDSMKLMQGKDFDLGEYKTFLQELRKTMKGKLHVADTSRGRVGITELISQVERNKPHVLFVDYISLLNKKSNDWQDVAALSTGLKSIAQRYMIPVVAASQLNREHGITKKEVPGIEALSHSDVFGHDSDLVINMVKRSNSVLCAKIVKNRNGPSGRNIWIRFQPQRGHFAEVSYNVAQELIELDREDDFDDEH